MPAQCYSHRHRQQRANKQLPDGDLPREATGGAQCPQIQAGKHSLPTSLFDHSSQLFSHRPTLVGFDSTWRSEKRIGRWDPARWFIKAQQISTGSSLQTSISGTDLLVYLDKNGPNSTYTFWLSLPRVVGRILTREVCQVMCQVVERSGSRK